MLKRHFVRSRTEDIIVKTARTYISLSYEINKNQVFFIFAQQQISRKVDYIPSSILRHLHHPTTIHPPNLNTPNPQKLDLVKRIPSLDKETENRSYPRHPHQAAHRRKLAVILQEDIHKVVHQPAAQVEQRELVERLHGHLGGVGGHDARGVKPDGLKAVVGGRLGAQDAVYLLLGEGGVFGEVFFCFAGAVVGWEGGVSKSMVMVMLMLVVGGWL